MMSHAVKHIVQQAVKHMVLHAVKHKVQQAVKYSREDQRVVHRQDELNVAKVPRACSFLTAGGTSAASRIVKRTCSS